MAHRARFVVLALATSLVLSTAAEAKNDPEGRPWARGTWSVGPGIGFGFSSLVTSLSFGVGGEYYVLNGWSFGADISDSIFIYSSSLRAEFPGIEKQIATNAFFFVPRTRYVFYRSYRFSPWAFAGVGPVALNHGGGAVGQWVAGPGAYIGLAGPVYLSLGVTFSGLFPGNKCLDAFTYVDPSGPGGAEVDIICGFRWSPNIGIVIAPRGTTRRERRAREEERRRPLPPHPMPPPEPVREPEPPPPEPEPEPDPEPETPTEEPVDTVPEEPVDEQTPP